MDILDLHPEQIVTPILHGGASGIAQGANSHLEISGGGVPRAWRLTNDTGGDLYVKENATACTPAASATWAHDVLHDGETKWYSQQATIAIYVPVTGVAVVYVDGGTGDKNLFATCYF